MKAYLIQFTHTVYCGGWDDVTENRLVYAEDYNRAKAKLAGWYESARDFQNLTIE